MSSSEAEFNAFGCGLLLGTAAMAVAMSLTVWLKYVSREDVIEHGAAYYHPETGEFTWREKPEESE